MPTDLRGVFAPIVTPFRPSDGEVDLPWIARHLAYLRAHGCTGVIPCGTNGEAASLSVAERIQVAEATLAAAGDMPVVVGTGAAALPDAVVLTRHAFASGAAAVLVMPPFYFKKPPEVGVVAWFQRLFDAAVPPGGRVLLYHIPQITGVPITDGVLQALLASHGAVVYGLKDSYRRPGAGCASAAGFPASRVLCRQRSPRGRGVRRWRRGFDHCGRERFPGSGRSGAAGRLGWARCCGCPGGPERGPLFARSLSVAAGDQGGSGRCRRAGAHRGPTAAGRAVARAARRAAGKIIGEAARVAAQRLRSAQYRSRSTHHGFVRHSSLFQEHS